MIKRLFVFTILILPFMLHAELRTAKVFSNHMVLQRGQALPVWGWSNPGAKVTVKIAGQEQTATCDPHGKWSLNLAPLTQSAEGQAMEISNDAGDSLKLEDILVGDVWICSGQSNMEWSVRASMNPAEEIKAANHPKIRLFNVPGHETAPLPIAELRGNPSWQICSPQTIANFSAVGYYFGRELNGETNVPIGLIGTNWGGTRVEPWTPPIGFRGQPELANLSASVDRLIPSTPSGKATWDKFLSDTDQWVNTARTAIANGQPLPAQPKSPGPNNGGSPTAIYNAMVAPLAPFGVKGAIWYQGESNGGEGMGYLPKLKALIDGWRTTWNQGEAPFYFYVVQLANFQNDNKAPAGGDGYARIRVAQSEILKTPNTGLACIIDIGEARDIHPKNKQDVGKRLAQWALRDVHGKSDTVVSGPIFREMKIEGGKARLSFDHIGGGLIVGKKTGLAPVTADPAGKLHRFAICGKDKNWVWANAAIDGDTVVVESPNVPEPVAVRYAYSANPEGANLYNKAGLPTVPFPDGSILERTC